MYVLTWHVTLKLLLSENTYSHSALWLCYLLLTEYLHFFLGINRLHQGLFQRISMFQRRIQLSWFAQSHAKLLHLLCYSCIFPGFSRLLLYYLDCLGVVHQQLNMGSSTDITKDFTLLRQGAEVIRKFTDCLWDLLSIPF